MTLTPKEKAKELVDKYIPMTKSFVTNIGWVESPELAKQCALLCVDEIIQHAEKAYRNEDIIIGAKLYWEEVQQEIEII